MFLGKIQEKVKNASIQKAIQEEVYAACEKQQDVKKFSEWISGTGQHKIPLTIAYDMGWNARSSGHIYNSNSGFSFVVE